MSHQGLGSGSDIFRESSLATLKKYSWDYGNLSTIQAENKQSEVIKQLDLQCENEKLLWRISTLEVESAQVISQM